MALESVVAIWPPINNVEYECEERLADRHCSYDVQLQTYSLINLITPKGSKR